MQSLQLSCLAVGSAVTFDRMAGPSGIWMRRFLQHHLIIITTNILLNEDPEASVMASIIGHCGIAQVPPNIQAMQLTGNSQRRGSTCTPHLSNTKRCTLPCRFVRCKDGHCGDP